MRPALFPAEAHYSCYGRLEVTSHLGLCLFCVTCDCVFSGFFWPLAQCISGPATDKAWFASCLGSAGREHHELQSLPFSIFFHCHCPSLPNASKCNKHAISLAMFSTSCCAVWLKLAVASIDCSTSWRREGFMASSHRQRSSDRLKKDGNWRKNRCWSRSLLTCSGCLWA